MTSQNEFFFLTLRDLNYSETEKKIRMSKIRSIGVLLTRWEAFEIVTSLI